MATRDNKPVRCAYICTALTELPFEVQELFKFLLSRTADLCEEILGVRGFAPHEHNDPVGEPDKTPAEVNAHERPQVGKKSSVLIVYTLAPSWGGGIEVEIANANGVPVVLLQQIRKDPKSGKIIWKQPVSRLLRGNPAVKLEIQFETYDKLFAELREVLPEVALPM